MLGLAGRDCLAALPAPKIASATVHCAWVTSTSESPLVVADTAIEGLFFWGPYAAL